MAEEASALEIFDEEPMSFNRLRLTDLADRYLLQTTRLHRGLFEEVLDMISPQLQRQTWRCNALPTDTQLLIALGFYASGGFQWLSGMCGQVSQSTCSRVVASVTDALHELVPNVIRFPLTVEEQDETKIAFHEIAGFPNVLGCIDGTHINIRRPPTEHQEQYVNRHQRFSMNVMAVCDARMRFTSVFADYPGSNADGYIYGQSALARLFENGTIVDGWLLGDSVYQLQLSMMTPLHNPVTNAERRYQAADTKTRCTIERAFGLLKSRFRCLDDSGRILCYSPRKVCRISMACCVLHNMCLDAGIELEVDPGVAERIAEMAANPQRAPLAGAAAARQRRLIEETAWPGLR